MTSRSYTKQCADLGLSNGYPVFRESCSRNERTYPPRPVIASAHHVILSAAKNLLLALFYLVLIAVLAGAAFAETVNISAPASVTFYVLDVGSTTSADENPTTISFIDASLAAGYSLRISVKAEAADFTPPGGDSIPAANVSWTTSGAVGGSGSNGQLSSASYTQVYQSNADPSSGSVNVSWTLSAPGASIRAGNHTLFIRWKLESVPP